MPPKKLAKAKKEPGPWVKHVKKFAKVNEVTYGCAMSDPDCSKSYKTKEMITKTPCCKGDLDFSSVRWADGPNVLNDLYKKQKAANPNMPNIKFPRKLDPSRARLDKYGNIVYD